MKNGDIEFHRARGVEQRDEPQRLGFALAKLQVDRLAAARDRAADRRAQVEPAAFRAGALAAGEARAHGAGETLGERMRLGAFTLACQLGEVLLR